MKEINYNDEVIKNISQMLGVEIHSKEYRNPLLYDQSQKEALIDIIYYLKENSQKHEYLNKEHYIDISSFTSELHYAIDKMLELIFPNSKTRGILEWWVWQRSSISDREPLKAWDKDTGEELKMDEIEDLLVILQKLEDDCNFDFNLEVIKNG